MADLEMKFSAAVQVIQRVPENGPFQPSNEMKLKFFALYKQAKVGPCNEAEPAFYDVIARKKWDAWHNLGRMDKNEAMMTYIETIKQIIETMNFTADVENFIEVLGPFYEYVDEDTVKSNSPKQNIENKLPYTLEEMLGSYVEKDNCQNNLGNVSLAITNGISSNESVNVYDEDDDDECNENHSKLLEEIQLAKESLEQTKHILKDVCSSFNKVDDGYCQEEILSEEDDINKGLNNSENLIMDKESHTQELESLMYIETNVESDDDIFEDSVEEQSSNRSKSSGSIANVEVSNQHLQPSYKVPNDRGAIYLDDLIFDSSSSSSPINYRAPAAPVHHRYSMDMINQLEEEEILIVSSSNLAECVPSCEPSPSHCDTLGYHIQMAVMQINRDLEHLKARMSSLETIASLRREVAARNTWWSGMLPSAQLLMITWPLITVGAIEIIKAAIRKSRR